MYSWVVALAVVSVVLLLVEWYATTYSILLFSDLKLRVSGTCAFVMRTYLAYYDVAASEMPCDWNRIREQLVLELLRTQSFFLG